MMLCLQEIIDTSRNKLKLASIQSANIDSVLLLSYILGVSREYLITHSQEVISEKNCLDYFAIIDRRIKGEPVSKILGKKEFYGRDFIVNSDVLDPRPDSELIIDTAKELFSNRNEKLKFLDLGTGSGCLLLTLLLEFRDARGVGIDISEKAIEVAKRNSYLHALNDRGSFIISDWLDSIKFEDFNLIVCNPPYIPDEDINDLNKDVKLYDPIVALSGGNDGLRYYKKIITQLKKKNLNKKIIFIMELYSDSADAIIKLMINAGYEANTIKIRQDLSNKRRVMFTDL
ncbi:MAG: peptide chain release factor N(5)-glutamine methyltransferase [Hyphomicrobiales bacterium]|nr:peptide chain release factor N(5)-glutamine methyltransferase [Hyphomicrobiales bacterium]